MIGVWNDSVGYLQCFIRLTTRKYAESFVKSGQIFFNTPEAWVKRANEPGGRGDLLEGVLGICPITRIEDSVKMREYFEKYTEVYSNTIDQSLIFRSSRNMHLPSLCFYMFQFSQFSNQENWESGSIHELNIPGQYFKDFAENKTKEEIEKMAEPERPSIIIINNAHNFLERVENYLLGIGVKKDEIVFSNVKYVDKNMGRCAGCIDYHVPMELYYKDISYSQQQEARIVINTDNQTVLEILKNPVNIGSLEDISDKYDEYLPHGLSVQISAN